MWHLGFRGRDIDLPTGKDGIEGAADVATLDTSAMCPRCHYGVVQVGPLRIPASQLSRCTGFVQIISGITTILVDGELIEKLGFQMWHGVELRKVTQTGKGVKGKDWFQILPMRTLPATMFFNYYRIIRTCSECKKAYWLRKRPGIIMDDNFFYSTHYHTLEYENLPEWLFANSPFVRTDDGVLPKIHYSKVDNRIIAYPSHSVLLSSKAAQILATLNDRRIQPSKLSEPLASAPSAVKEAFEKLRIFDFEPS